MTTTPRCRVLLCTAALAAACAQPSSTSDSGPSGPPNICNSQSDATSDAACQLQNGTQASYYLDHQGKQMWLAYTLPAGITDTSLLTVQAGYSAEVGSPVQLVVQLLTASQLPIYPRTADDHDPGPPNIISITTPCTTEAGAPLASGQQIFVVLSDDGNQQFDDREPFYITASVASDPDPNQPGVVTPITLTAGAGGAYTSSPSPGVISTNNRVDEFSVTIPSSVTKPVLYLSLTVPSELLDGGTLVPPIAYLMSYNLYDCGSTAVAACAGPPVTGAITATDHMPNAFLPVDLDTARLVNAGDTYLIDVQGWNDPSNPVTDVPGDIRATYALVVMVISDTDPYDDTNQPFQVTGLSVGGSQVTLSNGVLNHIAQVDTFSIAVPAQSSNTRIHYVFTPPASGATGSFPPLSEHQVPHIALLYTPVQGTVTACETDYATCPNDTANVTLSGPAANGYLTDQYCEADGGPFCVYSYRQEDTVDFTQMQNFEGIIPVVAGTSQIYLTYQFQGGASADNLPYSLQLTWLAEGAENQASYHMSETAAIPGTLTADVPPSANFPAPPPGASSFTGLISIGDSITSGAVQTLKGVNDYDAIPATLDVYQLSIPAIPGGGTLGVTWELQWSTENTGPGGMPPYTLEVFPYFCSDGTCDSPTDQDPFEDLNSGLAFSAGVQAQTWYGSNSSTVWSQTVAGGSTLDTVQAGGCFCFEPQYVPSGQMYLFVTAADRTSYADAKYTLTTAVTSYPQSSGDGGTCPAVDGGIPNGGTIPSYTACGMAPQQGCGGSGANCTSNAECCSQSCNIQNNGTGGFSGQGACN